MIVESRPNISEDSVRRQIGYAVDLIVHVHRSRKDGSRRITSITAVEGFSDGNIVRNELFRWNDRDQHFEALQQQSMPIKEKILDADAPYDPAWFGIRGRHGSGGHSRARCGGRGGGRMGARLGNRRGRIDATRGQRRGREGRRAAAHAQDEQAQGPGRLAAAGLDMDPAAWASILLALAAAAGLLLMLAAGPLAKSSPAPSRRLARQSSRSGPGPARGCRFSTSSSRGRCRWWRKACRGAGISIERALATAADNADEPLHSVLADAVASYSIDGDTVAALDAAAARAEQRRHEADMRGGQDAQGERRRPVPRPGPDCPDHRHAQRHEEAHSREHGSREIHGEDPRDGSDRGVLRTARDPPGGARDFYATPAGAAVIAAVVAAAGVGIALTRKFSDIDID